MRFSEEHLNIAASVNIVDYCAAKGIPLRRFNGETYCHVEYDSLKITGNKWIRYSGKHNGHGFIKGTAIHFVQEYENIDFREAVTRLLEFKCIKLEKPSVRAKLERYARQEPEREIEAFEKAIPLPAAPAPPKKSAPAPASSPIIISKTPNPEPEPEAEMDISYSGSKNKLFLQPEKNDTTKHVFMYLTETRGIDRDIVNLMIKKRLLYEDTRLNCVFPGYNKKGIMQYAALKGTNSKRPFTGETNGSKKLIGWSYAPAKESGTLRVFESAIDAMSFMALEKQAGRKWEDCHYLALGGVAKPGLYNYLRGHKEVSTVQICFDNDPAGIDNAKIIAEELRASGKVSTVEILVPENKDFNDDLKKNEIRRQSVDEKTKPE